MVELNEILLLIIVFLLLIVIIIILHRNKLKTICNKYMERICEYENIIDEQSKKNHEYNNQLLVLNGYLDNKKKFKEYFKTIVEDHRTGQNYQVRQLSNFPSGGFKSLLYYKLGYIKENNIKCYLFTTEDIKMYFKNFDVKMNKDLTKLFGVIIDNAIDAAKTSFKKEIEMDFKLDGSYIIIKVNNTYSNDISRIGEVGFSTKGKGHGYGLSIIKDIIRKNDKLEIVTEVNNDMFSQIILIDVR